MGFFCGVVGTLEYSGWDLNIWWVQRRFLGYLSCKK
jgi:hypothetical protein